MAYSTQLQPIIQLARKPDSKKTFRAPKSFFLTILLWKLQNNMFYWGLNWILLCWRTQAFQSATSNPSKYRALKPDSKKNFSGPEKFFFESCFRKLQNNVFLGAQLILLCWRTQAFQSATSNPSKYRALKPDSKKNFSGPEKFFFLNPALESFKPTCFWGLNWYYCAGEPIHDSWHLHWSLKLLWGCTKAYFQFFHLGPVLASSTFPTSLPRLSSL